MNKDINVTKEFKSNVNMQKLTENAEIDNKNIEILHDENINSVETETINTEINKNDNDFNSFELEEEVIISETPLNIKNELKKNKKNIILCVIACLSIAGIIGIIKKKK